MAELELQYVINATMGKLNGLTQLTTQLHELKRLAAEGADFGVRIDAAALNGITSAVAKAVSAGVRGAGGAVATGAAPSGGSSNSFGVASAHDMNALVTEMRNVVSALKAMTGNGTNAPARRMGGYAPSSPVAGVAGELEQAVGRQESASQFNTNKAYNVLARIKKVTKDIERGKGDVDSVISEIMKRLEEAEQVGGRSFNRQFKGRISQARTNRAMQGTSEGHDEQAFEQLVGLYNDVRNKLKDREIALQRLITNANKHQRVVDDHSSYRGEASAYRAQGGVSGTLAFNQAAIDAAFQHAADVFGRRLLAYLPEGRMGRAPGMPGTSTPAPGYVRAAHGAAADQFSYNEEMGDLVVPFSAGYKAQLETRLKSKSALLNKGTYDHFGKQVPLSDQDKERLKMQIEDYTNQYYAGGVQYGRVKGSGRLINGVYGTASEFQRYATDPAQAPMRAGLGGMLANNPITETTKHTQELNKALHDLTSLDIQKLQASFAAISKSVESLGTTMNAVRSTVKELNGPGMNLEYTKRLNAEKERHEEWKKNFKVEAQSKAEAARVSAQAERMQKDMALRSFQSGMPDLALSGPQLQSTITRRFRQLERLQRRHSDLTFERAALEASGGNTTPISGDIFNNAAKYQGSRSALLKDLQRAAQVSPRGFGMLEKAGLSGIVAENDRVQGGVSSLNDYVNARQLAVKLGEAQKKSGNASYGPQIDAAKTTMQDAATALHALGFGSGALKQDPRALQAQVFGARQALDPQIAGITKLAAQHVEARNATIEHMKSWDLFAKKLRDVSIYASAAGAVYGITRLAQKGVTDARMFEADLADVQGIFVSKSPYQRAQVQRGVMGAAYDYGIGRQMATGVAKTFAQTGASPEKTLDLTRATLMAKRGAGLNPDQATEMLIAVDNITGGRVTPGDIIDRISRVEARHAVTAQDMSTIIQKVGPLAEHLQPGMLGTSDGLDMLMGMGTSMIERTRMSGNQAATTLKFLMARLSAPQVQKKLQEQFGVMLGERNGGEMRNMTDIFGDIAGKYKGFVAEGQTGKAASLLTTFAGARQAASAAAMFEDWTSSMKVAEESSLAFGDAQRRVAISMDTLDARLGQLDVAFGNFATAILEKTHLLGGLKLLAQGGAAVLNAGANDPGSSIFTMGAAAVTAGAFLKGAWMTSLLKEAPVMSRLVPALGTGALVVGAGALGYGIGTTADRYYNREEYAKSDRELYLGPAEFSRDTYDKSEQGKQFASMAKKYGYSPDGFSSLLAQQVAASSAAGTALYGPENGDETRHRKLARFLEEDLSRRLQDMLPGFKDLGDQTTKTAEAMEALRGAVQFNGVSFAVQQSEYVEKSGTLLQQFRQAFNSDSPMQDLNRRIADTHGFTYRFRLPGEERDRSVKYDIETSPEMLGMRFNAAMAQNLHAGTSRRSVYSSILNSYAPDLMVGSALSRFRPGGKADLYSQVDSLVSGGSTYGKALDTVFQNVKKLNSVELERLKVKQAQNTATKEELALLAKHKNYQDLVDTLGGTTGSALNVIARQQKARTDAPGGFLASVFGGGGEAMATIMQALEESSAKNAGRLQDDSPQGKALREYLKRQADPAHRERTKLDIIGSVTGTNMRAYLKDKVMEEFFRYGERQNEISLQKEYLPLAGQGFNEVRETAANDLQSLNSFLKISAALPYDRLRATHRLNLARLAGGSWQGLSDAGAEAFGGEGELAVSDSGKSFNITAQEAVLGKIKKSGANLNKDQIAQLAIVVAQVRSALLEWQSGAPDDILDSLGPEDKKKLVAWMGVDPQSREMVATYGPTMQRFWLSYLAIKAKKSSALQYAQTTGAQNRGLSASTALSRVGSAYELAGLQLNAQMGTLNPLADATGFNIKQAMLATSYAGARASSQSIYDSKMLDIRARAAEHGIGPTDALVGDFLVEANDAANNLKQAVVDANIQAQSAMLSMLNDVQLAYLQKREAHVAQMTGMITGPLSDVLSDPRKLLGSAKGGFLASSIGGSINKKIADSFLDNLLGKDGVFGKKMDKLFGANVLFQEAEMIKQAHIVGITTGMQMAYGGLSGGAGAAGGATGLGLGAISVGSMIAGSTGLGLATLGMDATAMALNPAGGSANLNLGGLTAQAQAAKTSAQRKAVREAAIQQAMTMAGIYAGTQLGSVNGKKGRDGQANNYAAEGAQLGALAGSFLPIPGGTIIGSIAGGLLGGLFGKSEPPPTIPEYGALGKIERNTRETIEAIRNQTNALLSPENRLLYAPSSFAMPTYRPFGSSSSSGVGPNGTTFSITIPVSGAGDPQDVADRVAAALKEQLSGFGTYTDSKY